MMKPRPSGKEGRHHPRNTLNDLTGTEWIRFTKSWVRCDGKKWEFSSDIEMHPASFPPELAMDFISYFISRTGDTVLDPFVGCGSTIEACMRTGRRAVGIDLNPKWHQASERRSAALQNALPEAPSPLVLRADAHAVDSLGLPLLDYCVTSPPYWDMLRHSRGGVTSNHKKRLKSGLDTVYGDEPDDLGNLEDYTGYLSRLTAVFEKIHGLLKPGKYLTIIIQNIRLPGGEMVPVAWDLANRLKDTYHLRQERIWVQDQKMLGIWGYPTTYVSNVHHHYCLIFQKS